MHTDRCGITCRQKCCAKGSGKDVKIQEFRYRDTTNVEPEMYDYTSNNWSHWNSNKKLNLYRTNVTAPVMQPCTCCWPNVAATVMQCMHEFIQLSPSLVETETQSNSTVVPTTGLAFIRSHYVIFGRLGFDIIYGCT